MTIFELLSIISLLLSGAAFYLLVSLSGEIARIFVAIRALDKSLQPPTPPEPKEPPAQDNPGYTERLRGVDRHYDLSPPKPKNENVRQYASDAEAIADGVPIGGMYQAKSKPANTKKTKYK